MRPGVVHRRHGGHAGGRSSLVAAERAAVWLALAALAVAPSTVAGQPQTRRAAALAESIRVANTRLSAWSPRAIQTSAGRMVAVPQAVITRPEPRFLRQLVALTRAGALPTLLELLDDRDPNQQAAAAYAISVQRKADFSDAAARGRAIEALIRTMRATDHEEVLATTATALGSFGSSAVSAHGSLITLADSLALSPFVRTASVLAFCGIGVRAEAVMAALDRASQDSSSQLIRNAAGQTIACLRGAPPVPPNRSASDELPGLLRGLPVRGVGPAESPSCRPQVDSGLVAEVNAASRSIWERGRSREAVQTLKRALARDRHLVLAYNVLGTWYYGAAPDSGLTLLTDAIQHCPESAGLYFTRASLHAVRGDDRAALSDLSRARQLGLDDASLHYNVGNAHLRLGRRDAAIAAYDLAIARDSTHEKAWRNLVIAHAESGRRERALALIDRIVRAFPSSEMQQWATAARARLRQ